MFILRRITEDGLEINTMMGQEYVLVLKGNEKAFKEAIMEWDNESLEGVYGVITFNDSGFIMPLYVDSLYYIMTTDGNTFSNVSFKKQ